MILIEDGDFESALHALKMANMVRPVQTFAIRPDTETHPGIRTIWANENYL